MGRVILRCCCGSSIELQSWPAPEAKVADWYKVHNMCAVAWQHERGVRTTVTYPGQEEE